MRVVRYGRGICNSAWSVLVSPKRRKEGHERHRESSRTRQDSDPGNLIWSSLALLSADRLLSFEGEARLKASHGIRDRTSKGKARFQSLLGKQAPTGSDSPIHLKSKLTFSIGIEGCADPFHFSLCHLEIVCRELGYGVGRECQYISSSSWKAKGQEKLNRKEKHFCD